MRPPPPAQGTIGVSACHMHHSVSSEGFGSGEPGYRIVKKNEVMKKLIVIADSDQTHKFDTFDIDDMDVCLVTPDDVTFSDEVAAAASIGAYDLVFLRTKNLNFLKKLAQTRLSIPIVNPPAAVLRSLHRFTAVKTVGECGVRVPRQFRKGHLVDRDVIWKTPIDDDSDRPFKVSAREWNRHSRDGRSGPIYAQQVLSSKWEYKIYVTWDRCYCYRQVPTMIEPDKLSTREDTAASSAPVEQALLAAHAMNLAVASVDFLHADGQFYMTDINPTPGLQNLDGGYQAIVPYIRKLVNGQRHELDLPHDVVQLQGVTS